MKDQESTNPPFNLFSFLPKFDFRLPFPPKDANKPPPAVVDERRKAGDDARKPELVRFPKAELAVASVETEADVAGKTSNPVFIWQVYALGGFLILSWAWERWKERRPRRRSNDDEDEDKDEDSQDT